MSATFRNGAEESPDMGDDMVPGRENHLAAMTGPGPPIDHNDPSE